MVNSIPQKTSVSEPARTEFIRQPKKKSPSPTDPDTQFNMSMVAVSPSQMASEIQLPVLDPALDPAIDPKGSMGGLNKFYGKAKDGLVLPQSQVELEKQIRQEMLAGVSGPRNLQPSQVAVQPPQPSEANSILTVDAPDHSFSALQNQAQFSMGDQFSKMAEALTKDDLIAINSQSDSLKLPQQLRLQDDHGDGRPSVQVLSSQSIGMAQGFEVRDQVQERKRPWSGGLSGEEFIGMKGVIRAEEDGFFEETQPTEAKAAGKVSKGQVESQARSLPKYLAAESLKSSSLEFSGLDDRKVQKASLQSGVHLNPIDGNSQVIVSVPVANQIVSGMPGKAGASTEVSAFVVPGAMSKARISTDGLMGMSSGIQKLSLQGGGEMRVRLKPENLGELNVRIFMDGSGVGLQVHASDEKAKKIIEESLSYLKESLSAQNLSLTSIDISVLGSTPTQQDSETPLNFQDQAGQNQNQNLNQNLNHQQSQSGQWLGSELGSNSRPRSQPTNDQLTGLSTSSQVSRNSNRMAGVSGRLDVMA